MRFVFTYAFLIIFMSAEMILVGIILFGGMGAAATKIWLNKRKERIEQESLDENHA